MEELSVVSKISLFVLLALMAIYTVILYVAQIMILQGKQFKNPDGSVDDWHEQKILYGIAFADITIACPANIAAFVLIFIFPRWGFYLLSLASFWWIWANVMTSATSLRFFNPRFTLMWFIAFLSGALLGIAYIVWTFLNFDLIYLP